MHLPRLENLYSGMATAGLTRISVSCKIGEIALDIAVLAEPGLPGLFIGSEGTWLPIPVASGAHINPVLPHQDYLRILRMMNAESQKGVFKTGQFFAELDAALPDRVEPRMVLRTHMAARLFPAVPEADRVHFMGFQASAKGASVTAQNLEKTRLLLGSEAYELCRFLNCSSYWSQTSSKAVRMLPEISSLRKEAEALRAKYRARPRNPTGSPIPAGSRAPGDPEPHTAPPSPEAESQPEVASLSPDVPPLVSFTSSGESPPRAPAARMVLICGMRGAGKSTLTRLLSAATPGAVPLDIDVFGAPILDAALQSHAVTPDAPGVRYLIERILRPGAHEALMSLAYEMLSQGYTPVCTVDPSLPTLDLPALRAHLASNGIELHILWLVVPEAVCRSRIVLRDNAWDRYYLRYWGSSPDVSGKPALSPALLREATIPVTELDGSEPDSSKVVSAALRALALRPDAPDVATR